MVVACFPAGASAIRAGRVFSLRRAADLAAIVNQAIGGAPVPPLLSCRVSFKLLGLSVKQCKTGAARAEAGCSMRFSSR